MPEIRVQVSEKMDKTVEDISENIGIPKTEFVKNLIVNELKMRELRKNEQI